MSLARNSKQYLGVRAILPPDLQLATRIPTSADKAYVKGTLWLDTVTQSAFMWPGSGSWISLGLGSAGAINTLTGDSGGSIVPVAANITLAGTAAAGLTTAGSAGTITFNISAASTTQRGTLETSTDAESVTGTSAVVAVTPASLTARLAAPGAIGGTTPAAGTFTNLTAVGTVSLNASGAGVTTIGTGGTGATNIGNATGNTAVTGSLTASTGLVATTGGLQVNGGDIINSHSDAGTDVTIEVTNSDNTNGASRAGVEIATGGISAGDPYLSFQISGVAASTMTMGLDNSASDLFVISNSGAIGTSNALTLSQAGALNATTSVTAGTTLTATLGAITATNGNLVLNTAGNKIISTSVGAAAAAGANSFGTVTLIAGSETVSTTAVTASSIIILTRQSVGATGANDLGILSVGTIVGGTSFVINAWTATNATVLQTDDVSVIGWMIIN